MYPIGNDLSACPISQNATPYPATVNTDGHGRVNPSLARNALVATTSDTMARPSSNSGDTDRAEAGSDIPPQHAPHANMKQTPRLCPLVPRQSHGPHAKTLGMESVVALFREPQQAQGVLQALQQRGFEREHLGFALTDVVAEEDIAQRTGVSPEAGEPGGTASVLRGAFLGIIGGLAITTPIWLLLLIIPVTRIYQEGGLLGMLFGVIGGGALGALFGALAGSDHGNYVSLLRRMGVPAAQAEKFYAGLKGGHVMVIARDPSGTRADEALSLMRKHGAVKLDDAIGGGQLQSERH
ncbi:hypothetical protein GCM10008961_26700 [Deinococcus knuensis]|uniref:DUF1269 domain-containing protein n=2 Tax=Deinococcus knuensis TaxID=1837380 RepID=A0ABQ2SNS1_9DEIO|nr:hypothetical protein GCM10008961_26700 [Deinococcus knuensis]